MAPDMSEVLSMNTFSTIPDCDPQDMDYSFLQVILTRFRLAWKSHMMFFHTIKKQLRSSAKQNKKRHFN